MNKIILNVDDFGLTEGVNLAVFKLNQSGVVKSTTALVNSPYFKQGISEAENYPTLGIGIHLTIDLFKAEIYHPSLCDESLNFHKAKTHDLNRSLDCDVIYKEWKAQIEKFIEIAGYLPTHIDSHHHAHIFNHDAKIAVRKLAEEYNIPVREFKTDTYSSKCNGDFYDQGVSFEQLVTSIEELFATNADYLDVMMHPAFVDQELLDISSYATKRQLEYDVLTSNQFKSYLEQNNIKIANYSE